MSDFVLDTDFPSEYWEAYMEMKGFYPSLKVIANNKEYEFNFYDPVRLSQTIAIDLQENYISFSEPNLIVIESVNPENILNALNKEWAKNKFASFVGI